MRKIVLFNDLAPGDVVVMTAAIRDLHRKYPSEFLTDVRTTCPLIWKANPNITSLVGVDGDKINTHLRMISKENGKEHAKYKDEIQKSKKFIAELSKQSGVEFFRSNYGLINRSNQLNKHFINGYIYDLNNKLNLQVTLTELKPDLYLTEAEKLDKKIPGRYWLIMSGGKFDFTAKWWGAEKGTVRQWIPSAKLWQEVVDGLRGKVQFVQVGPNNSSEHWHPILRDVIDYRGKTDVRGLINLVYHAEGVICPVTQTMHIAAAFNKPCIVIAGGREPFWWEGYQRDNYEVNTGKPAPADYISQKYLHTLGKLDCCKYHGCWRSGIGEKKDGNCRYTIDHKGLWIPKCMSMITPEMVIEAVSDYIKGNNELPLTAKTLPVVESIPEPLLKVRVDTGKFTPFTLCFCMYGKGKLNARDDKTGTLFKTYEELHERMVKSIREFVPKNICKIRAGMNEVSDESEEMVKFYLQDISLDLKIYRGDNIRKYPRMREMFHDPVNPLDTDWVVWMDDDSAFTRSDWIDKLCQAMEKYPEARNFGKLYYWKLMEGQENWIKEASWYKRKPVDYYKEDKVIWFATGGWWAIESKIIKELDWPDPRIGHNGGDVALGMALKQQGYMIKNHDYGVLISGCKRRGISETPAGVTVVGKGRK